MKRDTVKIYDILPPRSILDLGLRHAEQVSLLTKVQNALLAEQSALIDLGYDTCLPVKEKGKRSFEALSAIAYQPNHIEQIDKHHRQITQKTCVISAMGDELETIKTFVLNAARKQGMTELTRVTGLADGVSNC